MRLFGFNINRNLPTVTKAKKEVKNDFEMKKEVYGTPPPGRVSSKDTGPDLKIPLIQDYELPDFLFEVIPLIRRLAIVNEDVGQVVFDLIQLANTGHRIKFDKNVPDDQVDKMRKHLYNRSKVWTDGVAGMEGLINKFIHQIIVGGALSNEWVINEDLTGIANIFMVKPETIRWKYNKPKLRYEAYQEVRHPDFPGGKSLIKLNPFTFKYYGLMGDTELPYGIPLYIPSLERVKNQRGMDKNINDVLDRLGIMGFFEALLAKPDQQKNENDTTYKARIEGLLKETKKNLSDSLADGITVGFMDEHEFNFHSTTKNLNGVGELYNQNQVQLSKGLKHPPAFLGVSTKGSETHINIVFTKMLSQLRNIQNLLKQNLEFGLSLELRLAGFKFNFLEIEFNKSTITDDLKNEQAREIRIRNNIALYNQGIISQETLADEEGYESPDQSEPRVVLDPSGDAEKKQDREKDKDKSDRKVREKNTPQPKRKDQQSS
jgi:hypothetical protein